MPWRGEPRLSQRFVPLKDDGELTAENFHTISTDVHIDHLVIMPVIQLGRANENAAGTVHFEALLDQNLLLAGSNAVRDHPGGAASGGGACGRVVSIVKDHTGMEAGFRIDGLAAHKVKEFSAATRKIFSGAVEIKAEVLQRFQGTQRGDGERNAGGDGVDGCSISE